MGSDLQPRPWAEPWGIVLGLFAVGNLANAAWMLVDPHHWYMNLPANVPGSGPLNEHFVRDIGCIFALIGVGLAIAVFRPRARLASLLVACGFYVAHSVVHVYDSARGLFDPGQWRFDLVPVYGATLLLVVVTIVFTRSGRGEKGVET
jgi:hypothetical protein